MSWRIYRSTDSGAPTLTDAVGKMTTLLQTVLVGTAGVAYGSKPSAGWTAPFTGTNKLVLLPGAAATSRMYYRVLDDGSVGVGRREAQLLGYETMSDVDTGTNRWPTIAINPNGCQLGKSHLTDGSTMAWVIAADDKTCILFTNVGTRWQMHYFGQIDSYVASDVWGSCIACHPVGTIPDGLNSGTAHDTLTFHSAGNTDWAEWQSLVFPRPYTGIAGAKQGSRIAGSGIFCRQNNGAGGNGTDGWGKLPKTNPGNGTVYLGDWILCEVGGPWVRRGKYRGVYMMAHLGSSWASGETFNGSGSMSAKQFEVYRVSPLQISGGAYEVKCLVALEISATVT